MDETLVPAGTGTVYLVCGKVGAGKTTHALALASRCAAVRFSIDAWMKTLFVPDQDGLDFAWIVQRVQRCETQIWQLAEQLLRLGTDVVLDLGVSTRAQRDVHRACAQALGAKLTVHFLDTPLALRRARVRRRNREEESATHEFVVTDMMFDFMENRFEVPDAAELVGGEHIVSD